MYTHAQKPEGDGVCAVASRAPTFKWVEVSYEGEDHQVLFQTVEFDKLKEVLDPMVRYTSIPLLTEMASKSEEILRLVVLTMRLPLTPSNIQELVRTSKSMAVIFVSVFIFFVVLDSLTMVDSWPLVHF